MAIYSVSLIINARPRRHIICLHVATAAALLEHIVADTKTEIDGHSSWVGVSQYEYVARCKMHNSVTYNTSRQCGPIALAPRAAWRVRPMCAGKPALANKRHDSSDPRPLFTLSNWQQRRRVDHSERPSRNYSMTTRQGFRTRIADRSPAGRRLASGSRGWEPRASGRAVVCGGAAARCSAWRGGDRRRRRGALADPVAVADGGFAVAARPPGG